MDCQKSGGSVLGENVTLTDATVRMWGTPTARDEQRSPEAAMAKKESFGRGEVTALTTQSKMRATPRASMNENRTGKGAPSHGVTHGETLVGQSKDWWPTPKTTNDRTATPADALRNSPGLRSVATTTDGASGSPKVDLNPCFVAALMGLPTDWLTLSTSAVTDWCRRQQQEQSDNYSHAQAGS